MFPDHNNPQAPMQPQSGALPPVQVPQPAAFMQQAPAQSAPVPPSRDLPATVEQVKLLNQQYGANPYAFNAAYQQIKAKYLLEHFHIDPNLESK
jgi:hypothetical protein